LGYKELAENIDKKFDNYFVEGDISSQDIAKTCDRYVKEVLGENSKVTTLLKVSCSQGILSPAWVRLKLFILPDFPFKDVKGGWTIFVIFDEDKIVVVHKKKERSVDELLDGQTMFQFTWELKMIFDRKLEKLRESQLVISHLTMVKEIMPIEKQEEIRSIMNHWKGLSVTRTIKRKRNTSPNRLRGSPHLHVGSPATRHRHLPRPREKSEKRSSHGRPGDKKASLQQQMNRSASDGSVPNFKKNVKSETKQ